jgi:aminoglycoside phosphotransferase (APT) family kinase protein
MSLGSGNAMEDVPDLGAPPSRLTLDVETVRDLIADQFPQWGHLPITPIATPGWDNFTFHLADDMVVRLPSAAEYALAVEKEHRWLPLLAKQLPTAIPVPLARGVPGSGYPYPWSVYGWLPGDPAASSALADPLGFAKDVADFLEALRRIDPAGGPKPGIHNWFRGATLRTYDATARGALTELEGHLDVDLATAVWDGALSASWDGVDVWFHGDLAPGNLLVERDRLSAVIDFGTCGVGDPSCDLAIAWTLLDPSGRQLLRDRFGMDRSAWARGRGWALWKTLRSLANALEDRDQPAEAEARLVVDAILDDFVAAD